MLPIATDEELNDLWAELDDAEKHRIWGLSSDLNTLRDGEKWVDSDWPPMTEEELGRAQWEAFHAEEWDKLLELLRRPPRFARRLPWITCAAGLGRRWGIRKSPCYSLITRPD